MLVAGRKGKLIIAEDIVVIAQQVMADPKQFGSVYHTDRWWIFALQDAHPFFLPNHAFHHDSFQFAVLAMSLQV